METYVTPRFGGEVMRLYCNRCDPRWVNPPPANKQLKKDEEMDRFLMLVDRLCVTFNELEETIDGRANINYFVDLL